MRAFPALILFLFSVTTQAIDLFWVGGTGNWDDGTHWSFSSGGPGCGCVPTEEDDVFFDNASFFSANDTVHYMGDSYCHDLTWTSDAAEATIMGTSITYLSGSLVLAAPMNFVHTGTLHFNGSGPGKTIATNGNLLTVNILRFDGLNSTWTLIDSLILSPSSKLNLYTGTMITNDQYIRSGSMGMYWTADVDLGSSTIELNDAYGPMATIALTILHNVTVLAGTSKFIFNGGPDVRVEVFNAALHELEFLNDTAVA